MTTYVVESSTEGDVASRERCDYWSELMQSYHCRLGFYYPLTDFHWRVSRQRSASYQLVACRAAEVHVERTARQIRHDPNDDYRLVIPLAGTVHVRHDGNVIDLRPGTAALIDVNRPLAYRMTEANEHLVLTVHRREVDERLPRTTPATGMLGLTGGLGRIIGEMATSMYEERHNLDTVHFDAVCDHLVELLCLLLTGGPQTAPDRLADVEAAVRRYVREHAVDPDLNGSSVAHAIGWSLRRVQLALQRAGTTPSDLIREERLRLAHERLQSPAYRHHSIGMVAYLSGFRSPSALSSTFRRRYGLSPREVRQEAGRLDE